MADINRITDSYTRLVSDIGRASLHALFPNDFEYYLTGLELTDSDGNTIDYFVFPVMPQSISKSENNRINVKKTATSTVVINTKHFIPHDLTLKGNFGRSFKILLQSNEPINFRALRYSIKSGINKSNDLLESVTKEIKTQFDPVVKTGYGCIKILQSIIDKAKGVDAKGKPFKLYFYNPALGESYLVVPSTNPLVLSQDEAQNNMIWSYLLNLIIISEISSSKSQSAKDSLSILLSKGIIQKNINKTAKRITNFIARRANV